mmetsp:Transcript_10689/g.14795  ORF Transcript_10689/g.14795 Transcript_10689/m.14795 type:complete len:403 (+) Transcript_10689:60-1268(+)
MDDPRACDYCGVTPVKYRCTRCQFGFYCKRECQREAYKSHKLYCRPLAEAVEEIIAEARPLIKDHSRLNDKEQRSERCFLCLDEGVIDDDELVNPMCGCRQANSVGHLRCFKDYLENKAQNELKGDLKADISTDALMQCDLCQQFRMGIVALEATLLAWRYSDPSGEHLSHQVKNLSSEKSTQAYFSLTKLNILLTTVDVYLPNLHKLKNVRLRLLFRIKDMIKASDLDYNNTIIAKAQMNSHIACIYKVDNCTTQANNVLRATHEDLRALTDDRPDVTRKINSMRKVIALALADNLIVLTQSSPPTSNYFVHLKEAETLFRWLLTLAQDPNFPAVQTDKIIFQAQLGQSLRLQFKFNEALEAFDLSLAKAKRTLGSNHQITKQVESDRNVCLTEKDLLANS